MMKIIIVGASGTIGKHIAGSLEKEHEIIRVGSKSGDLQADITSAESIKQLFEKTGPFDALVSTAGNAHFGPLQALTEKEFAVGVNSKMMGQINLVLIGQHYIKPKGSFTLISGVLSEQPVLSGANPAAVNGAVEAFVRAAAIELENGVRINAVSPTVVEESPEYFPYFPGHIPATMREVIYAFHKSILGAGTGQVIKVY